MVNGIQPDSVMNETPGFSRSLGMPEHGMV